MPLKDGSIGWLVAVQTALYLDNLVRAIESALQAEEPLTDEEFTLIVAYSLNYGGINPAGRTLPSGTTLQNLLFDLQHGKNLPSEETRKVLLRWIADELQKEVAKIKPSVG